MRGRNFPSWCVSKYSPGALVPWFCWTQWLNSLEHTTNSQITSSWQIARLKKSLFPLLWFPAYRTAFIRSKLRKSASRNSSTEWQWSIANIASATRWLLYRQTTDCKESMFQAFHHRVLCLSNPQKASLGVSWTFTSVTIHRKLAWRTHTDCTINLSSLSWC